MDVIAIHKALTQIWPNGIKREAYPVLAGLVKVLLDNRPVVTLGPNMAMVPAPTGDTSGLFPYPISKAGSVIWDSLFAVKASSDPTAPRERPVTPKIQAARKPDATATLDGRDHLVEHKTVEIAFFDPFGRVSSEALTRVYDAVKEYPNSGAAMLAEPAGLSFYTTHRALGVLAKQGLVIASQPSGNKNNPWIYKVAKSPA